MSGTLLLIIVLILIAMALVVVEVCTPTFGVVGLLALGSLAWAVYLAWSIDQFFGLVMLIAVLVLMPVYIILAVKLLPRTALGRRLYLHRDASPPGEGTPESEELTRLVGQTTTAETTLRPAGTVRIDGRRIVAQAESGMIDRGQEVRVVRAAGNRVIVRKVES